MQSPEKKEVVTIFKDPLSEEKPEGEARLKKLLNENLGEYDNRVLQEWEVEFLEEPKGIFRRRILRDNPNAGARQYLVVKEKTFDSFISSAKKKWKEKLSLRLIKDKKNFGVLRQKFESKEKIFVEVDGANLSGVLGISTGFVPFFVLLKTKKSREGIGLFGNIHLTKRKESAH